MLSKGIRKSPCPDIGRLVTDMPRAVAWYRFYCYAHAMFNFGLFAVSAWFIVQSQVLANSLVSAPVILGVGLVCAPLSLVLAGVNVVLVRSKSIKNAWATHMSNIIVGIASCVLAPLAVPLLFAWFHPSVRAYYEASVNPP